MLSWLPSRPRLFHRPCHHAAFAESTGTDKNQVVRTIHELTDIPHFIHPVSEELLLDDCPEFERIIHITIFFVTIFFVVGDNSGKDRKLMRNAECGII